MRTDDGTLNLKELHRFYDFVEEKKKFGMVERILDHVPFSQAIVFVNRVERAKMLSQKLDDILFNPITIHSHLTQNERL